MSFFLTDQDARPDNSAHPRTHLWDNNPDAVSELDRVMKIRERALGNFSEKKYPRRRAIIHFGKCTCTDVSISSLSTDFSG